jgi:hypothetical protein
MNSEEVVFFDTDNLSSSPPPSPLPLPPFETSPDAIVAPPHLEELAQQIVQLNLLELKELVDKIANAFEFDDDVMAASYMNGAALMGASGGSGNSEPVEEAPAKVIFDVKLIGTFLITVELGLLSLATLAVVVVSSHSTPFPISFSYFNVRVRCQGQNQSHQRNSSYFWIGFERSQGIGRSGSQGICEGSKAVRAYWVWLYMGCICD